MKIGVIRSGWWEHACRAGQQDFVELPGAVGPNGNSHTADLTARVQLGAQLVQLVRETQPRLLLDNAGAGLAFVQDPQQRDNYRLAHEDAGVPLCSHFIDPLVTAFQGLAWQAVWQSLKSKGWLKAVWDHAQAEELRRFGVPNVVHLRMAAPDRRYNVDPVDPEQVGPVVSFVGGQNTSYFTGLQQVPTSQLLAGTIAQAVRGDLPGVSFYDVYHRLYELAEPPQPDEPHQTQVDKTQAYFAAKLFYHAQLCIRNRDRFVIFLKRKLGDAFELIGRRWDTAYGLACAPPLPGPDAYFDHFRTTAINVNLVNGNAETGVNMRHFEITAAGGFLLCYDQPELAGCFDVGEECDVFRNEQELLEKVEFYLANPQRRAEIARAGQQRTLREHLYSHRLAELLALLTAHPASAGLGGGAASPSPARTDATDSTDSRGEPQAGADVEACLTTTAP